jgi:CheY-like chemotaxis protein
MRRTVLVIDDNEPLAQALCRALRAANPEFEVEFLIPSHPLDIEKLVQETEERLNRSNQNPIIVINIHLGENLQDGRKGVEYLKHLRGAVNSKASRLPVVLLSLDKPDQSNNQPDRLCFLPGCRVVWLLDQNFLTNLKDILNEMQCLQDSEYRRLLQNYIVRALIFEAFSVKHHGDIKAVTEGNSIYQDLKGLGDLHKQLTQHIAAWQRLEKTACRLGDLLRYAGYCSEINSLKSGLSELVTVGKRLEACLTGGTGRKQKASRKVEAEVKHILEAIEKAKNAFDEIMRLTQR